MSLKQKQEKYGLIYDDIFYEKIEQYKNILKTWGATHNLTASIDDGFIDENIVDSLFVLKSIDIAGSFADIGTGAGYPGLILAIAMPDIECYLIEPHKKKSAFLNFVVQSLDMKNTKVLSKKVQLCGDISAQYITSRAVTNVKELLNMCENIAHNDTIYLLYKGSSYKNELKNIDKNIELIRGLDNRRYIVLT